MVFSGDVIGSFSYGKHDSLRGRIHPVGLFHQPDSYLQLSDVYEWIEVGVGCGIDQTSIQCYLITTLQFVGHSL